MISAYGSVVWLAPSDGEHISSREENCFLKAASYGVRLILEEKVSLRIALLRENSVPTDAVDQYSKPSRHRKPTDYRALFAGVGGQHQKIVARCQSL